MDHKEASVCDAIHRTTEYRVRIGIPTSTGFQVTSTKCTWLMERPASAKVFWSNWVIPAVEKFEIVRCGLGSGKPVNIEVQIDFAKESDKPDYEFQVSNVTMPQAWHRDDNQFDYYIRESITFNVGANEEVSVRATSAASGEGLYAEGKSPGHLKGHT